MKISAITANGFDSVSDRVAKIQDSAQPAFFFICCHDLGFDLATPGHHLLKGLRILFEQLGEVSFQSAEKGRVVNDSVFNYFSQSRAEFTPWERAQGLRITKHDLRLIKCAHQIFSSLEIYPDFAADRTIHLREERRRHLHKIYSTQVSRRHEASQIAHYPAAQSNDERTAFQVMSGQLIVASLDILQVFGLFSCWKGDQLGFEACVGQRKQSRLRPQPGDVSIRDKRAAAAQLEPVDPPTRP